MDLGYMAVGGGGVDIRIYYLQGFVPGDGQTPGDAPLVNGPRGYCLDVTNLSGATVKLRVSLGDIDALNVAVGQGDPVTAGVARSRTAAQIAAVGITTRKQAQLTLE